MGHKWTTEPADGGFLLVCVFGKGRDDVARKFVRAPEDKAIQQRAIDYTRREMEHAIRTRRCGTLG